jgi:hypothetical protein
MQRLAVTVVPDFLGLIFPLDIYRSGVPVILLAWDVIAALQQ